MEFGLIDEPSNIPTDAELLSLISQIRLESPALGESLVAGRLRAQGYKVTRQRIRTTLRAIDPLSVALRWPGGLTRRNPYSIPGPNSLRHIGKCIMEASIDLNNTRCTSGGSSDSGRAGLLEGCLSIMTSFTVLLVSTWLLT